MKTIANFLFVVIVLASAATYGEPQKPRFGIYMPKLDVYTQTDDVAERVNAYLHHSKPDQISLAEYPIISEDDLESYDWQTHTLYLHQSIWFKVREPGMRGLPFVVVADGVPIYIGAFYSSSSSIPVPVPVVIWDYQRKAKELLIQKAYPFTETTKEGIDPRDDPRLKKVLQELGKLKTQEKEQRAEILKRIPDQCSVWVALASRQCWEKHGQYARATRR